VYSEVFLKQARDARDEARAPLKRGIDPSLKQRAEKLAHGSTCDEVAAEYLKLHEHEQSATTQRTAKQPLHDSVSPRFGSKQIGDSTPHNLLGMLKRTEATGSLETCAGQGTVRSHLPSRGCNRPS
jgi:hypothetical protein